jgi:hypothetical protein
LVEDDGFSDDLCFDGPSNDTLLAIFVNAAENESTTLCFEDDDEFSDDFFRFDGESERSEDFRFEELFFDPLPLSLSLNIISFFSPFTFIIILRCF